MSPHLIRTTITLPEPLHQSLRFEAIRQKKSLGAVILQKIQGKHSSAANLADDRALFAQVAKSGKKIDLARALRQERHRDDA